jgi:hypothetical protein
MQQTLHPLWRLNGATYTSSLLNARPQAMFSYAHQALKGALHALLLAPGGAQAG